MRSTPSKPRNYRGVSHPPAGHLPVALPYGLFGPPALPNSSLPGFQDTEADLQAAEAAKAAEAAEALANIRLDQQTHLARDNNGPGVNTTPQHTANQSFSDRDRAAPGSNTMAQKLANQSFLGRDRAVPEANTMVRDASLQSSTQESTYSSIRPCEEVAVSETDYSMPVTLQHQTHNFSQLASARRIHEWNNSVFDDRWVKTPAEMYHHGGRTSSVNTADSRRQSVSSRAERPVAQGSICQPSSQQNRDGINAHAESTAQETLETLSSIKYNPGNERRHIRNVDRNPNSFLGHPESRQPTDTGLDRAVETHSAYMALMPTAEERRKERERSA